MPRAIASMIGNTPQLEHVVLAPNPSEYPGVRTVPLPRDPARALVAIRRMEKLLEPDVVHAHSSVAGGLVRMVSRTPVIYQPHAFAHLAISRGRVFRLLAHAGERLVSHRTAAYATLSPAESAAARSLLARVSVFEIPNVPSVTASELGRRPAGHTPEVVMVGRVSVQKGPSFFAEVARLARSQGDSFRFSWLGDGDEAAKADLEAAGVRVTGWLPAERLAEHLRAADVYLHSAEYEGFPISVLDANAAGLPVVVRPIDALKHLDLPAVPTPCDALATVRRVLGDPAVRAEVMSRQAAALRGMDDDGQRDRVTDMYRTVVGCARCHAGPNS